METTKNNSDLETKLTGLKDQFLENLKATKLVVDPRIEGLTLYYQPRRRSQEVCNSLRTGLKVLLMRSYGDNVNIAFEIKDDSYSAKLQVLGEDNDDEKQLAYDALTKINQFIVNYIQFKKEKR